MSFFQRQPSGLVDPQEYMTIGKLMERLRLQSGVAGNSSLSTSGLQRIQEEREGGIGPETTGGAEHT